MHGLWEENCLTSFGCTVFCVWVTAAAVLKGVESNWDKILDLRYLFFFSSHFFNYHLKTWGAPLGREGVVGTEHADNSLMEFPSSWKKGRTENCVYFFSPNSVSVWVWEKFVSCPTSPISSTSSPQNLPFYLDSLPDYQGITLLPESAVLSFNFA